MRRVVSAGLFLLTISLAGCNTIYYKAMRGLGREKRDILVARVKDAKQDQEHTKQQIKTTMESFQELTGFQGGSLEQSYKRLNSEYEKANDQATKLHNRIQSIDQVSNDLFKEWQSEIGEMSNPKLKSQSTAMLRNAKVREAVYMKTMTRTEEKMKPVLNAFHDQVLFLKHNLNAQAIGSLKGTSTSIQGNVADLIASIDSSMQEADKLIASLSTSAN
jgi:predicted small secreted protein